MIRDILLVGTGSALGGILRLLAGKAFLQLFHYPFPIATFAVNVSGSFLIGLLYALYDKTGSLSPSVLLFLTTGLCGGFTTFSSFTYENLLLMKNGQYMMAAVYIVGSLVLGMISVIAGYAVGK